MKNKISIFWSEFCYCLACFISKKVTEDCCSTVFYRSELAEAKEEISELKDKLYQYQQRLYTYEVSNKLS